MLKTCIAAAVFALALAGAAAAGQRTSESFTFSDPLTGSLSCGAFDVEISGQDKGHVKTWFDADGNPIKQEGHITAIEIDTKTTSLKSIVIRTALAVHIDFAAGTVAITGARNMSTEPERVSSSSTSAASSSGRTARRSRSAASSRSSRRLTWKTISAPRSRSAPRQHSPVRQIRSPSASYSSVACSPARSATSADAR